uniref:Elongator complex protein 5 n=1 Tax=Oryza brachyantha TaxID=4533 RepID=J3LL38_ORYBR
MQEQRGGRTGGRPRDAVGQEGTEGGGGRERAQGQRRQGGGRRAAVEGRIPEEGDRREGAERRGRSKGVDVAAADQDFLDGVKRSGFYLKGRYISFELRLNLFPPISSMLRHASVSSISSFLSNLRSHDQISSIFWHIHSDLREPKFSRAFECLTTMVASSEPVVVDSVHEEEIPGDVSFLEENYSKANFYVRLKRRNGRVKHLYEELHVEGNEVRFVSMPSVKFNLELSEKERSDRANVVLPFEHQGKGEPIRIYDGR